MSRLGWTGLVRTGPPSRPEARTVHSIALLVLRNLCADAHQQAAKSVFLLFTLHIVLYNVGGLRRTTAYEHGCSSEIQSDHKPHLGLWKVYLREASVCLLSKLLETSVPVRR